MDIPTPSALRARWGYAQGGLARLAQARQDRPGKGGTGLNQYSNVYKTLRVSFHGRTCCAG